MWSDECLFRSSPDSVARGGICGHISDFLFIYCNRELLVYVDAVALFSFWFFPGLVARFHSLLLIMFL